ncbi:MAG: type IV pili methyl-accepting chemotaxis transducer N-terminal domain-containing protein [Litoreibacter sp.]
MYERLKTSNAFGFRGLATSALGIAIVATSLTGANAADNAVKGKLWKDIGASERVDFSGRLHMLSQRIAASTCNLEAGVETTISKGILAASSDEIDRIVKALEFGNPLMKIIGEETNPRIMANIAKINGQWTPIRATISDVVEDGGNSKGTYQEFEQWNVPFYEDANVLVSEVAAQYSDPADLLQGDAILVDLAGRQRMRTQKLLKEACSIWKDAADQSEKDVLMETIGLFDRTLVALRDGAPVIGIKAAPSEQISDALVKLTSDWDNTKPALVTVAEGQVLPDNEITRVYLDLNEMLIKSNDIVTLYTKYAKHTY